MTNLQFSTFRLNNKLFQIPSQFKRMGDIPNSIYQILKQGEPYDVSSKVSEELFQQFVDYLDKKIDIEIHIDNYIELSQLASEFTQEELQQKIDAKKSKWREIENFLDNQMQNQSNNNQNQEFQSFFNQISEAFHKFDQKIDQIQTNFRNYQIEIDSRFDIIKREGENNNEELKSNLTNDIREMHNQTSLQIDALQEEMHLKDSFISTQMNKNQDLMNEIEKNNERMELLQGIISELKENILQFENDVEQKSSEIKLREEVEMKKRKINDLIHFGLVNEAVKKIDFCIPIGQNWYTMNSKQCTLNYQNKTINVTSSSTHCDQDDHHPRHLFNGKLENENGGLRWGTDRGVCDPFILIQFNTPVLTNLILISSRGQYYNEASTKFEVLASNNGNDFVSLCKKSGVSWNTNERKLFPFYNEKKFSVYKIIFYTSFIVSLAELNLAEI